MILAARSPDPQVKSSYFAQKVRSYFAIIVLQDAIILFLDFIVANHGTIDLSLHLGFSLPSVQSN